MLRGRAILDSCLAAAVGLGATASTAVAQGGGGEPPPPMIPPVEVVATRLPEAPHDVPASIEVIKGADLVARGATTLGAALSLAAGVSIAPGGDGGPASAVPELWGLREFDAFLLVVDNVPWGGAFNPALSSLSLRDVDRIEILRGPAPVTFGATSFVGVIHVVHKPAADKTTYYGANGGSFGSGGLSVDMPLFSGSVWKSRATVDYDKQGYKDDRTSYSRGHLLWRTSKEENDRKVWFNFDANLLQQDPASPAPREGATLSSQVPIDANHNPAGAYLNDNRYALSFGWERPVMNNVTWGATGSYTHSEQKIFRGFLVDLANIANNATGFRENIDLNDFYGDTHLIWPSWHDIRFMVGGDILYGKGEAKGATFDYTAPLDGATAPSVTKPSNLNLDVGDERTFLGAYASAEWRPANTPLIVNGGVRMNSTMEKRGESSSSVKHARVSGSIGATYGLWEQAENHVRVFANYRSTFKPAAYDFGLGEEAVGQEETVLNPETSSSYEGGLKIRAVHGTIDVEASYFDMDFRNLVTATVVNNLPALTNAGKTRFKGVELATELRLEHDVSARATYSYHDGKFVDYTANFDGVFQNVGGNRFEMSARNLYSVGVTYAPPLGFVANANLNYTGDRQLNKRNTALAPAFTTFDAGIGWRTERAEFRLDGRNLGDRRDPISESEFGDAQYYRMPARSIRLGVAMKY